MKERGYDGMQVLKHSKSWIIIRNLRQISSADANGTELKDHFKMVVDACWAGNRWQPLVGFAQKFDCRHDAEKYLARNRATMGRAPVASTV